MRREFIRTATFDRSWTVAGLGDEELRELENMLLQNPSAGDVIPHLAALAKYALRWKDAANRAALA